MLRYTDLRRTDLPLSELQELERNSILIVDPISTRFPPLQEHFRNSRLDLSRSLPIVRVGLNDQVFKRVPETRLMIRLLFKSEFGARRARYDPHCDEVWDKARFLQFLGNEIPRVLNSADQASKGIRAQFNQFQNK